MGLNLDFKEFIESLNDNSVRYLIVGGYAVAHHGHPRYTKDLDIWIDLEVSNAERMVQAIDQFGFAALGLKADDFLEVDTIIQIGFPPSRIDILTTIPGVDFDVCHSARVVVDIDGIPVNFIDVENLKKAKQASGRPQDLADLARLQKRRL